MHGTTTWTAAKHTLDHLSRPSSSSLLDSDSDDDAEMTSPEYDYDVILVGAGMASICVFNR